MKLKSFGDKFYPIPEQWSDVTVGMLIRANELMNVLEDAPIIAILSAYTGIPVNQLKSNTASEVTQILEIMEFMNQEYVAVPTNTFIHQDQEYFASDDLRNQKFEDFVSIQTALYNFRDEPEKALPRLLAIYCKRATETLDSFDLNERSILMEQLPMTTAKNVEAFFLHSLNAYSVTTQVFSMVEDGTLEKLLLIKVAELQNTMKVSKAGTGWFSLTRLQIGYLQIYLWYFKKVLVNYFSSFHTETSKKNWKVTLKEFLTKMLRRKDKRVI